MKRTIALILGIVALSALPTTASAQKYKKQTEYNFEEDTIDGSLTRPDGEYVEARKKTRHSNLIKIRENFRDKLLQSIGEL